MINQLKPVFETKIYKNYNIGIKYSYNYVE
jgi:hypothetical protein